MQALFYLLSSVVAVQASAIERRADGVQGFDISNNQPSVDFAAAKADGAEFVIIKVRQ
jgi:GH25 family lysozyme M1 (1,4-beta-N-acetylmuramidase)